MHTIDELTEKQIGIAASKKLTAEELSFYLTKAQKDLSLGQKRREKMAEMIGTVYDPTMWGVINAVTETAQELTLDSRVEAETWAGNMLDMAA